jgi:D-proline reductase (dithiol) PrdB
MVSQEAPVRYIERTRDYYRALGYQRDYVWARFDEVPFERLAQPLAATRIGLVTTASPLDLANRDPRGIRRVWSGATAPPPPRLFTDNLAWDKESTDTDDRASFLPIETVLELSGEGVIGGLATRFHGVPTEYSHRKTVEEDAPQVLAGLRDDGAQAAILCPL